MKKDTKELERMKGEFSLLRSRMAEPESPADGAVSPADCRRLSEASYRKIFDCSPEAIVFLGGDGTLLDVNDRLFEWLGFRPAEVIGRKLIDLPCLSEESKARAGHKLIRRMAGETIPPYELEFLTRDGRTRVGRVAAAPIRDGSGNIVSDLVMISDVTGRKQSEELLQLQRDLGVALSVTTNLPEALNFLLDAIFRVEGIDSGCVYMVEKRTGALELVANKGLSSRYVSATSHFEADAPQTRMVMKGLPVYAPHRDIAPIMDRVRLDEGLKGMAVIPVRHKDWIVAVLNVSSHTHEEIPIRARHSLESIAAQIGGAIARIEAETSLAESERKNKELADLLPQAVYEIDMHGAFTYINRKFTDYFEYDEADLAPGLNIADVLSLEAGETPAGWEAGWPIDGREHHGVECAARRKSGSTFPVLVHSSRIERGGRTVGSRGVVLDISDWKRAEERLRKAHSDYRQIVEVAVPMLVIDNDFTMLTVNESYCRTFRMEAEEFIGKKCYEVWSGPMCHTPDCAMEQIRSGKERHEYEWEEVHPDGERSVFVVSAVPYRDPDGELLGIIENYTDISDRRRAEEQLRQARDELEMRVAERTSELARANEVLRREISEHRNTLEKLEQRNRELDLLNRTSQAMAATLDLDQVLTKVLEEVRGLLDVQLCSAWLVDRTSGELICRQAIGPGCDRLFGWCIDRDHGLAGSAMASGKSLVVREAGTDDRYHGRIDERTGLTIRSVLCAPLMVKQKAIGVLHLMDSVAGRFTEEDRGLVESLAATAALAIDNAGLFEQARQDAETKSTLLNEVNHRVKNNLSAIVGLLYAEEDDFKRGDREAFRSVKHDLISRVQGLATVHSLLSSSEWEPVRLGELTSRIIRSCIQVFPGEHRVEVDISPSPLTVTPDQANHLALVINELATNALKHASRSGEPVRITVGIDRSDGWVSFEFRDDGPGYPPDVLEAGRHGVGFDLIENFVRRHLGGVLALGNDGGAVATVRFRSGEEQEASR